MTSKFKFEIFLAFEISPMQWQCKSKIIIPLMM